MSGSRFTWHVAPRPRFVLTFRVDGILVGAPREFEYDGAAVEAGQAWVAQQDADLAACFDRHPAGKAVSAGRHRLSEPLLDEAA